MPNFTGFTGNKRVKTKQIDMESVWIEATTNDPVEQVFAFQRIRITQDGMTLVPLPMRYAYPPETDLMARMGQI